MAGTPEVQPIQVLPVQNTGGIPAGGQVVQIQQNAQQPQVIQTTDGQTLIYQPVQVDGGTTILQPNTQGLSQGQIILGGQQTVSQQATAAQQQTVTGQPAAAVQQGAAGGQGNIIMMVPGAGGAPSIQRIPLPGKKLLKINIISNY